MASSTPSGIAKMIVQYKWILGNVDGEPQTYASKMILFRGEKVFRVGLKNLADRPVLFFMAIDLNKMGMRTSVRAQNYFNTSPHNRN
jgi:speckle-type POZ protein